MVDVICPPLSISSIVVSLWLAGCLAKSTLIGWREYYGGGGVGVTDTCVEPSKREDLTQCCFNIGPPPTALDQHWNNIGSSLRVCWESCPHFDTCVPSVSGWNRLHSALCTFFMQKYNWPRFLHYMSLIQLSCNTLYLWTFFLTSDLINYLSNQH